MDDRRRERLTESERIMFQSYRFPEFLRTVEENAFHKEKSHLIDDRRRRIASNVRTVFSEHRRRVASDDRRKFLVLASGFDSNW
uniref:Uncharacterized protein n=1 Tax=Nelumbo nucifera TaxID=4432 RepID=A0A822YGL9_NELNU|nr:TPA_asm: hypothetical protein HUJ06_010433 [Nelumbo nucifera]